MMEAVVVFSLAFVGGSQAFHVPHHNVIHRYYSVTASPSKSPANTVLQLGFLDFGSNTINTPVLHSSLVTDFPGDESGLGLLNATLGETDSAASFAVNNNNLPATSVSSPQQQKQQSTSFVSSFWGYRLLLAGVACVYGTNFPLGSILDHALPPSAASSARFFLAALALSPFLPKLEKDLIGPALFAGCFTATGYITQSLALADTSPATVSFLGAATVIWCPFLEWLIHKKSMSWKESPQVWVAALFCLTGVGLLELFDAGASLSTGGLIGDGLALLQAVGFGTGIFMSEQMMKKHPQQALPITSVLVAVTAFLSMIWAFADGWIGTAPGWESMMLPNILMGNTGDLMASSGLAMDDPLLLAKAVLWTGLISTSLNFFLEVFALGQVPPGEASVVLATEPLWAAAFASIILGESMGWNDYAGGALIVAACLVSGLQAGDIHKVFGTPAPPELASSEESHQSSA
jgi:drug/metabolite transporter (DMT)-like permease